MEKTMSRWLYAAAAMIALGCSESVSTPPDTGVPSTDSGAVPSDAYVASSDSAAADGGGLPATVMLVVNELQPQGDDFAEIVNAGPSPLSLDGMMVADADGIGEPPPDPTHRTPFPGGIVLAPGEHFVIAMNLEDAASSALVTDPALCRGAARCVHTSYGMSAGAGDSVAVLDAAGAVLAGGDYAGAAATGLASGESWCRLPSVSGEFAVCAQTPGAVNIPL